jgi:ABC-type antimicrobial peptide transport system permease subunit
LAVAVGLMQLLSGLLFGGRTFDAGTLLIVVVILGASASVAAYLPARRVRRIDPMLALRSD